MILCVWKSIKGGSIMATHKGVTLIDKAHKNGPWQIRIKRKLPSGKEVDIKRRISKTGKPFEKAEDAYNEMCEIWEQLVKEDGGNSAGAKKTIGQIYEEFKNSKVACSKSLGTLRKHDSVWRNHIADEFADRKINSVKTSEINAFLTDKYRNGVRKDGSKLSYGYVESFVKFFYLIYGYAQSCDYISISHYNKMFENDNTKIKMPERRPSDKKKEVPDTYSEEQLAVIKQCLSEGDAELLPAFYIARYTGMRVGEVFGLRWSDVDFKNKKICVKRQMFYENGIYELAEVKTKNSIREILMPDVLYRFLNDFRKRQIKQQANYGLRYRDVGKVIDTVENREVTDDEKDFINRRKDGKLLTPNDIKQYGKVLKAQNINFHFHTLRHTYATDCASHNMSELMLMEMMGHEKIDTTKQYYINTRNEKLIETTFTKLNEAMKPIAEPTVGYAVSEMLDDVLTQIPNSSTIGVDEYKAIMSALSQDVPDIGSGKYLLEPVVLSEEVDDGVIAKKYLTNGTAILVKEKR